MSEISGIKDQNIVFFALPRFDAKYTSASFYIARELAKNNRVLFVDNPFTLSDLLKSSNKHQLKKRFRYQFSFGKNYFDWQGNTNLKILITPPILPINFLPKGGVYNLLSRINHRWVGKRIRKALKQLGWQQYLYVNSFNFYFPDLDRYLNPILSVYHCVDQLIKPYSKRHGVYLEKRLMEKVDLIITTSQALQEEKKKFNTNCYLVPNAADFEHSSKALDPNLEIPDTLEKLKKPLIGYLGAIERRMDFDLLVQVIRKHPEWTFVLAGPADAQYVPSEIHDFDHVVFTGAVPYAQVPAYLKAFDVALIPFKIDEVSRTIFPLKLYEYLGAGKPVVALNFNPDVLEPLKDIIYLADNVQSFEQGIVQALNENSEELLEKRLEIARQNTWESRGKAFAQILARALKEGGK